MSRTLARVLRGYQKSGDELVVELPVRGVELAILQAAFGVPETDPMYDCYPVTAAQVDLLRPFGAIDLDAYDFFLECDALD